MVNALSPFVIWQGEAIHIHGMEGHKLPTI